MNEKQIALFESLDSQLKGLYDEMQTLAKKNPNDAVNRFKLGLINNLIKRTNGFLKEEQKPFGDFGEFSDAELPSNSDVLIILSQYLSCLEKIRANNNRFWRLVLVDQRKKVQESNRASKKTRKKLVGSAQGICWTVVKGQKGSFCGSVILPDQVLYFDIPIQGFRLHAISTMTISIVGKLGSDLP